jgi:hypothetical protein
VPGRWKFGWATVYVLAMLLTAESLHAQPAQPLLTDEARLAFTRRVQPILFNCCGSLACHGRADAPGLELRVPVRFSQLTPLMTEHNLAQVLPLLNLEKPRESPLLQQALQPHGGSARPPLPGPNSAAYRTLENWVLEVAGKTGSNANGHDLARTAPETSVSPPVSVTASGTNPVAPAVPMGNSPAPIFAPGPTNPAAVAPVMPGNVGNSSLPWSGSAPLPTLNGRGTEKPVRSPGLGGLALPGAIVGSSSPGPAAGLPNSFTPLDSNARTSTGSASSAPTTVPRLPSASPNVVNNPPGLPIPTSHNLPPNPFASGTVLPRNRAPISLPNKPMPSTSTPADPFDPSVFNQMMHPPRR